MTKQSGLGRGLSALLPPSEVYETPKDKEIKLSGEPIENLDDEYEKTGSFLPENVHAPHIVGSKSSDASPHTGSIGSTSSTINTEKLPKQASPVIFMEEEKLTALISKLLTDLTSDTPGISVVYKALNNLVNDNALDDAIMVVNEPGLGKQVFTFDRRPLTGADEDYLNLEPGLYTSPQIDITPNDAMTLAQLCAVGLRMDLLKYDAWHDPLTGLYDRRSFDRLLDMAVARSVRYQWPFTLVLIDLDDFKELNDNDGHQAGDEALRSLGDRFRKILRFGDNAARIGGDEFALILPETEPEDVPPLLERIAMVNGDEPAIGFSYGLALCPSEADGIDSLFKLADERLYEAKSQRKDS